MNQQRETKIIKQNSLKNFSDVRLYVIISSGLSKKPVLETLQEVIKGGADAVQLREKTMSDGEFLALAKEFRRITSQSKILFIVNDRAEIAKKVDADGLHIGQSDLTIHCARKIIGYDRILGVSTHTIVQARKAQLEGADYISVGPLFPTITKDYEPPVGLDYLKEVKREITIPFVAIGAINHENLNEILLAGGLRVAICSAIICSNDILQTTRSFKAQIVNHSL
ncbi:MAG: thiamine phosphate synthase [Planctomycetes bacterium]|uniref:thiamine phosphate synthase n=1 Tax=Candidatus Wunengus sp. YC65 TaxID=3367701 RepID=UPI001E018E41|nr:thiamine phosphate synthase [Planctomycetota bacterium]